MQALYGDLEVFEAQEEALLKAELKAHASEHSAEMQAMQEARVRPKGGRGVLWFGHS